MHSTWLPLTIGLLSRHVLASPTPAFEPSVRQLLELPGVFIESIAVRSNGNILLGTLDNAQIYSIDPNAENPEAFVVAKVEDFNNIVNGMAEISPDVFAVASGQMDMETREYFSGTTDVSLVSFQPGQDAPSDPASVRTVLNLGEYGVESVNGMIALPSDPSILLGADSLTGRIWRMDTINGLVQRVFLDEELTPGSSGPFDLGVNGIKIFGDYLYYTNTGRQTFGRVQIDERGNQLSPAEIITRLDNTSSAPDDFAVDESGNAYIAYWPGLLIKVTPEGEQTVVLNGTIVNPTSVALSSDGRKAYVATSGQSTEPVTGGQLVEVTL